MQLHLRKANWLAGPGGRDLSWPDPQAWAWCILGRAFGSNCTGPGRPGTRNAPAQGGLDLGWLGLAWPRGAWGWCISGRTFGSKYTGPGPGAELAWAGPAPRRGLGVFRPGFSARNTPARGGLGLGWLGLARPRAMRLVYFGPDFRLEIHRPGLTWRWAGLAPAHEPGVFRAGFPARNTPARAGLALG